MSLLYRYHQNKEGLIIPCDSCGVDVPTTPLLWGPPYGQSHDYEHRHLCKICAGTFVGNLTRYKRDENYVVGQMIAQVANHLKEEMGLFPEKPQEP